MRWSRVLEAAPIALTLAVYAGVSAVVVFFSPALALFAAGVLLPIVTAFALQAP